MVGDVAEAVTVGAAVLVPTTSPASERAAVTVAVAVVVALTATTTTAVTVAVDVIVEATLATSDFVAVTVEVDVVVADTAPESERAAVTVAVAVSIVETSTASSEPRHDSTMIACWGRSRPSRLTTTPPAERSRDPVRRGSAFAATRRHHRSRFGSRQSRPPRGCCSREHT